MARFEHWAIGSFLVAFGALACSAAPPPAPAETPPPPEPEVENPEPAGPEPVETGQDCATAEAECDGGVCKTEIKNNCEAPITCEVLMMALCQSSTDAGEARGKARGTIPAGQSDTFQAAADCEGATVTATTVESLTCK